MSITKIGDTYGGKIFRIENPDDGLTMEQIADKCDPNNFGFRVAPVGDALEMVVYYD